LYCRIIIILNMEIVASREEIVGDPKLLGAGQEQQAAGPGSNLQQQQQKLPGANGASGQGLPQQAAPYTNAGYRPDVAGVGPVVGSYSDGRGGGSNVTQVAGAYNPYTAAVSGVKPDSGGFQRSPMGGGGGGVIQQAQPQNTFGRASAAPPYQPTPAYSNRGPIAKNEAPARIVPIAALNPYQGRWTIKARVTAKSEVRRFHNAKGDGKVFSFDLLDADKGEIRATCFNNVVDQFYDSIDVGRVYLVSKGSLKAAQKSFNHLKNDWEIFLESLSTVEPCFEEDGSIPQQHFDFRPISDIESVDNNAMVDVIGIVVSINLSSTIMRKNGVETHKRTLQIKDRSGHSVEITMWGSFCHKEGQQLQDLCDSGQNPVLAVKAGRVSDFSGKSVGTISTTQLLIDPDISAAHQLRDWFDREGRHSVSHSISREGGTGMRAELRKTVSSIKDEGLGRAEKPDWITVRATVFYIKPDNFYYTACPLDNGGKQCNKKVTNNGDGTWRCDRCDRHVPECDYRSVSSTS
jgi:replication factor A1